MLIVHAHKLHQNKWNNTQVLFHFHPHVLDVILNINPKTGQKIQRSSKEQAKISLLWQQIHIGHLWTQEFTDLHDDGSGWIVGVGHGEEGSPRNLCFSNSRIDKLKPSLNVVQTNPVFVLQETTGPLRDYHLKATHCPLNNEHNGGPAMQRHSHPVLSPLVFTLL